MPADITVRDQPHVETSADPGTIYENRPPIERHGKWVISFLLIYFGLRLIYFAVNISPLVPPDEVTHFGLSRIFSKVFLFPVNSPETYEYGLVTNIPWLYYWLMGKLLPLNLFGISDLLYLRLINIPLAFGTVYYAWRLLRLLTDDPYAQLLLVVAMTNTLMFTFLSASVSYDNLTNLLAAMAIYYLFAFFRDCSAHLLAASIVCQMAGCLAKVSFLPLVLILNLLLLIHVLRKLPELRSALPEQLRRAGWRSLPVLLVILLGLAFNVQLYGGNYLKYKKLNPEMTDVLPLEIAMQNRLAARGYIYKSFMAGRIPYGQALEMAAGINHPGDRRDTIYLVKSYLRFKQSGAELMSPVEYIIPWGERMLASVYGIMGHIAMLNQGLTIWPIIALIIFSFIATIIRWISGDITETTGFLTIIFIFYTLFLLYYFNYRAYSKTANFDFALQGRYIFPVIGVIYAISSYYLTRIFRNKIGKTLIIIIASLVFAGLDFPFYLLHRTDIWIY